MEIMVSVVMRTIEMAINAIIEIIDVAWLASRYIIIFLLSVAIVIVVPTMFKNIVLGELVAMVIMLVAMGVGYKIMGLCD